ncbi:hypothetical protein HYU20_01345, partial [Candidatus Woesearchaeota archaeon]|nr:hypothetical protein [Candidatus Woesearchaeota archaeon]
TLFDGIKTQINTQGTKFTVPFSLPPIKPHIEFKILVNESQIFTGKMKFLINTEIIPIGFEVQPTSEKKFTSNGKLKMSEKDTYSFTQLQDQFRLKEGDVVLISFAKTKRHAELGVLSQAVLANSAFARLLSERLGVRLERKWYYK